MIQEFTQEVKNLIHDILKDVHTIIQGKIESYNPDDCTAFILPYGKYKKPDGTTLDYPVIPDVPVYVTQGSGQTATIAVPVKKGDECLILFSEQTTDTWRTGALSSTDLRFDLSNAVAVVGMFARPNPLMREAYSDDAIIIQNGNGRIKMTKTDITVQAVNVMVNASGNATVTADGNVRVSGATVNIN